MDSLRLTCPSCRAKLRVPAEWVGRSIKCKKCAAVFQVKPGTQTLAQQTASKPPAAPPATVPTPSTIYPPPGTACPKPGQPTQQTFVPQPLLVNDFIPSETTLRYRGRQRGGLGWLIPLTLCLLLLIGGLVAGVMFKDELLSSINPQKKSDEYTQEEAASDKSNTGAKGSTLASITTKFPRRMLILSTTKYLYCNPLSAGNSKNPDMVGIAARRLAFQWKIPQDKNNNQLFIVQDVGTQARAMLKPVIEDTYKKFLDTSREQDRILIYFGGHATMIEEQAYLVPVDGELDQAETLIPLTQVYQALSECPATQKVIIFDVCRINEDGDRVRPGSEPMSEALEKALLTAPPGVQVITTTTAGKNALEFRNGPAEAPNEGGSLFLSSIIELASKGKVKLPTEAALNDPLPVDSWFEPIRSRMSEVAKLVGKDDPVAKLTGTMPNDLAQANSNSAVATRFELLPKPDSLPPNEVTKLLDRVSELPPFRGKQTEEDAVENLFPFTKETLAKYLPDASVSRDEIMAADTKYPHRKAALQTLELIKKEWRSSEDGATELRTMIPADIGEAFKRTIIFEQETPARIEGELEEKLVEFEKLAERLEDETSPYWQVTFLYTYAQLKARLAFMSEYNLALGSIRTDNIPMVDQSKGQAGLVLVASEKMRSKREVREQAEEAKELFLRIAKEHPGTPWAVLSKRHAVMGLGLEWKPYSIGNASVLD